MNQGISIAAMFVALAQFIFIINMFWSLKAGKKASGNPWNATTLEWQTPNTPAKHGNWGEKLPVVYRWAYDYSVPGAAQDFIPQNLAPEDVPKISTGSPAEEGRQG
jgi:cytochrome c oxidase subunit 1